LGSEHCKVEVRPDIGEVGGVYTHRGGKRIGPGKCLSAEEIEARFPGYDTSALTSGPRNGGWYTGCWESDSEGRKRAASVACWLKSPNLCIECSTPNCDKSLAVLFTHGHFTDMLLKAMMGIEDNPSYDKPGANNMLDHNVSFWAPNTGAVELRIQSGSVSMHSFGKTDHLQQNCMTHHRIHWKIPQVFLSGLVVGLIGAYSCIKLRQRAH